jgi:hypothetical protein
MVDMSDELLMAYADGALDPAIRATLETAIQKHPEYREKVAKFKATRGPIQEAFRRELGANDLGPLIDRIRRETLVAATPGVILMGVSGVKPRTQTYRFRRQLPWAMAASVALLVGVQLGWLLRSGSVATSPPAADLVTFRDGRLKAEGALRDLLERARSGAPVMVRMQDGSDWKLEASFTFRSTSQTSCRRYEMTGAATRRFAGYACRSGEGVWFVRAHADLNGKAPNGKGYALAAGDDDAALEAAIRIVMDGDAYQSDEEAELIASGWTTVR